MCKLHLKMKMNLKIMISLLNIYQTIQTFLQLHSSLLSKQYTRLALNFAKLFKFVLHPFRILFHS
jgi:hypothetical protein